MVVNIHSSTQIPGTELAWWKRTLIYHVYVPSFYDSNDDGYGDLKGRTEFHDIFRYFYRNQAFSSLASLIKKLFITPKGIKSHGRKKLEEN